MCSLLVAARQRVYATVVHNYHQSPWERQGWWETSWFQAFNLCAHMSSPLRERMDPQAPVKHRLRSPALPHSTLGAWSSGSHPRLWGWLLGPQTLSRTPRASGVWWLPLPGSVPAIFKVSDWYEETDTCHNWSFCLSVLRHPVPSEAGGNWPGGETLVHLCHPGRSAAGGPHGSWVRQPQGTAQESALESPVLLTS